jgi:hypothetical protein
MGDRRGRERSGSLYWNTAGGGSRNPAIQHTQQRLGEGETGRAALERWIIVIPDLRETPKARALMGLLIAEGFISNYAVPFIAKGHDRGLVAGTRPAQQRKRRPHPARD